MKRETIKSIFTQTGVQVHYDIFIKNDIPQRSYYWYNGLTKVTYAAGTSLIEVLKDIKYKEKDRRLV